ncbi:hypothetical protein [Stackebrandtia nassauensis]|uniref:Xylan 1,4-beta-xylosidase n=1 Tax=Stackebrandtia nassauensis (strain DSM 44728 / CIP 108903 / NRRL B-16338 / NBRC 102104 / LLR-40K-21) TaxID=446470 RepID=D3QAD2_STANL|nr:hypothetical protein [Stackebrandtia nassauensis]ADD42715.1 hypothetical protein Snas_3044 [Stackebrandtia nassauensis DSM 44728]
MRVFPLLGGRRRRAAVASAGALVLAVVGYTAATASADTNADFQVGYTHNNTAFPFGDDDATASAKEILSGTGPIQNQHLMGFGTDNPWPKQDGPRDFSSLEERLAAIKSTDGKPVITLCSAPGWMKPSGDDWEMNEAPKPEYYDEFAQLAAETAQKFPEVEYFQVWNEFKGFWNGSEPDYVEFTKFYNQVYDAVKEVRPDAKIGGPYVTLRNEYGQPGDSEVSGEWGEVNPGDIEAVRYWNENKSGAEFFTLDAWTIDGDGDALDPAQMKQMFSDVTAFFAAESGLPVWWSEYYAPLSGPKPGDDVDPTTPEAVTAALEGMRDGGASVALWWQPECGEGPHPCVFTDTSQAGGGKRTEFTEVAEAFSGR